MSREGVYKYQNQFQLGFKSKQEEGTVATPKIVQIGESSMLNSVECNGGFKPQKISENRMSIPLSRNMSQSARTPKTNHHTPIRQGGGFGRHVSRAEKEANEILKKELANVINSSTPSTGIRIRALKSFYNSTGRVQRGRERCQETNVNNVDMESQYSQKDEQQKRQQREEHHSRTQSRVPSSFYRSSPFSPIWKGDTNQTQVTGDSNISRTLFSQKIVFTSTDRTHQERKSSSARPSPSPNALLYNQLPNLDLDNIINHKPVTVESTIKCNPAGEDSKVTGAGEESKREKQEKNEENDSGSDTSEEMVEKMFIGQEFDTDDQGQTTIHPNHQSMTKLKQLEDREEIESIALQQTEQVKIPLITTEQLCETPHPKDTTPYLEIKIPIPSFQSQNEEEEQEKKEQEKEQRRGTPTAQSQPKIRKPRPCLSILSVTPLNLEQQFLKFQQSGYKENPQFEYQYPALAAKFMSQFKKPRTELLPMAKQILDNFLKDYGSESNYLENHCGRILTKSQVEQQFNKYIDDLGMQNHLSLMFSNNAVAPTSVVHDGKTGKSKICISMPIQYRQKRMIGVMHHEIGTHFLRKYNDKYQIWWAKRKQFEMKPCIATEEGLASINQLYEHALKGDPKPYLYKGALNYYACCKAAEMSFVELFEELSQYVDDPFRRWKFCLRVKRGMTDTSQPGGMYKDQVYLEGSVKILRNRKQLDFIGLHCGKMTVDDSLRPFIKKKIKKENCKFNVLLRDMKKYMKAVQIIAKTNNVDMPLPPKDQ